MEGWGGGTLDSVSALEIAEKRCTCGSTRPPPLPMVAIPPLGAGAGGGGAAQLPSRPHEPQATEALCPYRMPQPPLPRCRLGLVRAAWSPPPKLCRAGRPGVWESGCTRQPVIPVATETQGRLAGGRGSRGASHTRRTRAQAAAPASATTPTWPRAQQLVGVTPRRANQHCSHCSC